MVAGLGLLASCEDMSRQDPLLVRGSSSAIVFAGAPVYIDRPLAENLTDSLDFADYDVLLNRAGLMNTLRGPGRYTVFALGNATIEGIPKIYRDRMLDPRNVEGLAHLMGFTIVPGRFTRAQLVDLARKGGGRAGLATLYGQVLTIGLTPNGGLTLSDPAGRMSNIVLADIVQSNGLLYVGDRLLAP